jgi:hypothetical protein
MTTAFPRLSGFPKISMTNIMRRVPDPGRDKSNFGFQPYRQNYLAGKNEQAISKPPKLRPRCGIGPLFVNGFRGERKRNMQELAKALASLRAI